MKNMVYATVLHERQKQKHGLFNIQRESGETKRVENRHYIKHLLKYTIYAFAENILRNITSPTCKVSVSVLMIKVYASNDAVKKYKVS